MRTLNQQLKDISWFRGTKKTFNFTGEDMKTLVSQLNDHGFTVLADFLEDSLIEGFAVPGTMKDAVILTNIEGFYPEVIKALGMPMEDLPLYLNGKAFPMENEIAMWRLKIGK